MEPIPEEMVEKTWQEVAGFSPDRVKKEMMKIGNRQPELLLYIPNRISDIFDVARARLRVGPGFAIDARVTKYGDLYAGAYGSLFIGIHGPRLEPRIPWPIGLESRAGIEATAVADLATQGHTYGYGEIGTGFQAAIVGIDVGVDSAEILDLVLGFFFIDLTGDDF